MEQNKYSMLPCFGDLYALIFYCYLETILSNKLECVENFCQFSPLLRQSIHFAFHTLWKMLESEQNKCQVQYASVPPAFQAS
jgi:hypothetical protein